MDQVDIDNLPEFDNHKFVYRFENKATGLIGYVAVHNDNLGPAAGGTRMFPYATEHEALVDVLRLSRAMTYKCAIAGVPHGGGKAVIIGDPDKDKNESLIRSYANEIDKLAGALHTGEDVGISEDDVQIMLEESPFFIGKRGVAGDPSPYAAMSTFIALKAAARAIFGTDKLDDKKIAIKGVGKVGGELVELLKNVGAEMIISDIRKGATKKILDGYPDIKVVDSADIHKQDVDIFSPCALSNDLTESTINDIKAKIICGGANNQLASGKIGKLLSEMNILYIPDYLANCGGLINVVDELEPGGYKLERVLERIDRVADKTEEVIDLSKKENKPPNEVADEIAEAIFKNR